MIEHYHPFVCEKDCRTFLARMKKGHGMPLNKVLQPRVLVVDDERLSRTIVSRKLASLARIAEASDGREAMAVLQKSDVDLVVVDLDMPGINGLDLIKHMRSEPRFRTIPIIVLTADDRDGLQNSITAGATSALKKPLDWRVFGEHVRHVLELAFRSSHLASRDALTGLANRTQFEERLQAALAGAAADAPVAVLLLDLDRFKYVNDTLGHAAGDALLFDVARRLSEVVGDSGCIARLGGDEFAILQCLPKEDPVRAALDLGHTLVEVLGRDYELSEGKAQIGASIGIDIATSCGIAAEVLLKNADDALYAAKDAGRAAVRIHGNPAVGPWAPRLPDCAHNPGELICQPVFSLASGSLLACELRDLTAAPRPRDRVGKAQTIAYLEQAFRIAARWAPVMGVVLAIDPVEFRETELASTVLTHLGRSGGRPSRITLEVAAHRLTPRVLAQDDWRLLSNFGVAIAVRCAGPLNLPMETLLSPWLTQVRLDGTLVHKLPHCGITRRKVRALVGLASNIGLGVVATDVTSHAQLVAAAETGFTAMQGPARMDWMTMEAFARALSASECYQHERHAALLNSALK